MAINWIYPFRGLQAVFSIVVLGLAAYVSNWWLSHWHQMSPLQLDFMIFTPVWSILVLAALLVIPLRLSQLLDSPVVKCGLLALEGMTMAFWLGSFSAMVSFLRGRICFGTVCGAARTSIAFGLLNSIVWAVSFVYGVAGLVRRARWGQAAPVIKDVEMHQGL